MPYNPDYEEDSKQYRFQGTKDGAGKQNTFADHKQFALFNVGGRNWRVVKSFTMNGKPYVSVQCAFVPQKDDDGTPIEPTDITKLRFIKGKSVSVAVEYLHLLAEGIQGACEVFIKNRGVAIDEPSSPF